VEALTARPSPSGADGAEGDGELGALAEGVVLFAHELALVDADRGQQRDEARGAHAAPHERSKSLLTASLSAAAAIVHQVTASSTSKQIKVVAECMIRVNSFICRAKVGKGRR
jgi:hypothetical protein